MKDLFQASARFKKVFFLLLGLLFLPSAYSQDIGGTKGFNEDDAIVHLGKTRSVANECFAAGDTAACLEYESAIIAYYQKHRSRLVKNTNICDIVYEAYSSLNLWSKDALKTKIGYLKEALSLVDLNEAWADEHQPKQHTINLYTILIGELVDDNDLKEAAKYVDKMVDYAEKHFRMELPSVLLTACSMNSLAKRRDRNYPIYKRLYEMYDELDNIQRYEVVKGLISFDFDEGNYKDIIAYAKLHMSLITKSNDAVKDIILDFIGLSYCRYAWSLCNEKSEQYEPSVNDVFSEGYIWSKRNNLPFLPKMIVSWAYYLYGFDEHKPEAVALFYEFLDCLENMDNADLMFKDTYYSVEDAQEALISIICVDLLDSNSGKSINDVLERYNKVLPVLLSSGEYVQDLMSAINLVM